MGVNVVKDLRFLKHAHWLADLYLQSINITVDSCHILLYQLRVNHGRWDLEEHFRRLVRRFDMVQHRLLQNLGALRYLYGGVGRSVALYETPVWSHQLTGVRRCRIMLNGEQRRIPLGMRKDMVSFDAAIVMAWFPPLDILVEMDAPLYAGFRQAEEAGPPKMRWQKCWRAFVKWYERL